MLQTPVIQRAFELADSERCRIPSEVRRTLLSEGYTQPDVFGIEGRATQLRDRCCEAFQQRSAEGRTVPRPIPTRVRKWAPGNSFRGT